MYLLKRFANIRVAYIHSVNICSVFQIGDAKKITPKTNVLAVQRDYEKFNTKEGSFRSYQLFRESIPQPSFDEQFSGAYSNNSPNIYVDHVKILGISSSSIVNFGSAEEICAEARIKHIRQLSKNVDGDEKQR